VPSPPLKRTTFSAYLVATTVSILPSLLIQLVSQIADNCRLNMFFRKICCIAFNYVTKTKVVLGTSITGINTIQFINQIELVSVSFGLIFRPI